MGFGVTKRQILDREKIVGGGKSSHGQNISLGEIGFLFELKKGGFEVPMGQILEEKTTYQSNVKKI